MAEPKKPQTATMFDASAQPTSNGTAESSNGQQASGKTAQTQAPAPVAPSAPPAIPQILVDAGLRLASRLHAKHSLRREAQTKSLPVR